MTAVRIQGTSLSGLAIAARLARWGHRIELVGPGPCSSPARSSTNTPPVTTLPAAWRDLIKKTGRPMAGLLNAAHLSLVEAPAARHRFPDGSEVVLPTDRGEQTRALQHLVGRPQALAWAALLDHADGHWQALRHLGVERPFHAFASVERLEPDRTMAKAARALTDERLRLLWFSAAARAGASKGPQAPAMLGSRWAMERVFGRWQVVDADTGLARPMSVLTDLLVARLAELGVHPVGTASTDPARASVSAEVPTPPTSRWAWRRPARLLPDPRVHDTTDDAGSQSQPETTAGVRETVDHSADGPTVTWHWRVADGRDQVLVHDHTAAQLASADRTSAGTATPAAERLGWTIDTFAQWANRPSIHTEPGSWHASAASHAGNEPWAQLLTGAQVAYEVHEHLTGDDIRPTNREAPPPPRRTMPQRPQA